MAFAVDDYFDLLRLLSEHPEWRADLRRAVLPEDFESLPEAIRKLTQAQERTEAELAEFGRRTEARFGRLEAAITRLTEAQRRTEERVGRLEEAMVALTERTGRLEEAMTLLTRTQASMVQQMKRIEERGDRALGITLEWQYREKATGYFAGMIRRARHFPREELYDLTEGVLSQSEQRDVAMLDVVLRGRLVGKGEMPEVLLAVEVSVTLDDQDVNRAARRAALLRKAGQPAIPVVAGEGMTEDARTEAEVRHVAILRDGSTDFWEDALREWAPPT